VAGAPLVRINRAQQKAFFYKGGVLVGVSKISSGKETHGTPAGRYAITQKSKNHRSSTYGVFRDKATGEIVDDDVDIRNWQDVIWAMTTRMDPARDTIMIENTPIDYLDFASPVSGLGSKIGMDANNKWPGETNREWGTPITMNEEIKKRVDAIWDELGI
jgi:hypothetical protein